MSTHARESNEAMWVFEDTVCDDVTTTKTVIPSDQRESRDPQLPLVVVVPEPASPQASPSGIGEKSLYEICMKAGAQVSVFRPGSES